MTLSGTIVANTYANSGDANWLENPNIVAARTGPTGSFGSTLRHTQLGLSVNGPEIAAWRATGFVAMDFLGGAPGFALAVQWHPEWRVLENPTSRRLFAAFGAACRARQRVRHERDGALAPGA